MQTTAFIYYIYLIYCIYTWRFWCNSSLQNGKQCLSYNEASYHFLEVHYVFQGPLNCFHQITQDPPCFTAQRLNIWCFFCNSTQESEGFLWMFLMVVRLSANPLFQVIFEYVSLEGFLHSALSHLCFPHPSSCADCCFLLGAWIRVVHTTPQESIWHRFLDRYVNLSEGHGVEAGGSMREHRTANLVALGFKCKLQLEWWVGRLADQLLSEPSFYKRFQPCPRTVLKLKGIGVDFGSAWSRVHPQQW